MGLGAEHDPIEYPGDPALLAALGKVAIRHGQLDYVLRMTVKSILALPIPEALDATARQGSRELRERVRKLAKQKLGEGEPLTRLDALLERSRRATDKRNELFHRLWAHQLDGEPVIRDDGHNLLPIPSVAELEHWAEELATVATELNVARLEGFLRAALDRARGS